jgi:hypothetical protein
MGINSQYYRPFSATSNWFVAPDVFANYTHIPLYQGSQFVAEYSKSAAGGGLEAGYHSTYPKSETLHFCPPRPAVTAPLHCALLSMMSTIQSSHDRGDIWTLLGNGWMPIRERRMPFP